MEENDLDWDDNKKKYETMIEKELKRNNDEGMEPYPDQELEGWNSINQEE